MLIDVTDWKTIPKEIEDIVIRDFSKLPEGTVAEIKAKTIDNKNDILCAMGTNYRPLSYLSEQFYMELVSCMKNHELVLYHATKILNKSQVLERGLKTNEWGNYRLLLSESLDGLNYNMDNKNQVMNFVESQYKLKYPEMGRQAQLCFFSDMEQIDTEGTAGCEQFCENIGGEIARWALKGVHPDLYAPLKNNGEAFIVKFKLPFTDIVDFKQETILFSFVLYYAAKYFFNYKYNIQFTGVTTFDVPKENILDLIPYTKEVDY